MSRIGNHTLNLCLLQEEDATVWARYSSAQFDQGAGRHACNIPCNHDIDDVLAGDLQKNGKTEIAHNDFMDLIAPSFTGVKKVGKSKSKSYACVKRPAGMLKRPASHR